jgi:flagellin-specific chaperone FliS
MSENREEIQKLENLIKKKGLKLSENKIEEISQNLYNIGLFLVHLKIKHSEQAKQQSLEDSNQLPRKPT